MKGSFPDIIKTSNASLLRRNQLTYLVVENPNAIAELIQIGLDVSNKFHYKAIWIMELLADKTPELLSRYSTIIGETIPKYEDEPAIRGMTCVVYF